jgi:hypothetical protein
MVSKTRASLWANTTEEVLLIRSRLVPRQKALIHFARYATKDSKQTRRITSWEEVTSVMPCHDSDRAEQNNHTNASPLVVAVTKDPQDVRSSYNPRLGEKVTTT